MPFESLTLRNFQKHKKLVLELSDGITTITGKSGSGKSAVVRALLLLCSNTPSGGSDVRQGTESSSVRLGVDDRIVKRSRKGGKSTYRLDTAEIEAFGKEVPEEVGKLLNVTDLNFQGQHDPPLWFTETPGQVSRNLNQVVNLGVIDDVLAKVAGELTQAKAAVRVSEERLAKARKEYKRTKWVGRFEQDLERVEAIRDRHAELANKASSLGELLRGIRSLTRRADRAGRVRIAGKKMAEVGERAFALRKKRKALEGLIAEIRTVRKRSKIKVPDFSKVLEAKAVGDAVAEKRRAIEQLVEQIREAERSVCQSREYRLKLEKKLATATKGRCPMCGGKMSSLSTRATSTSTMRHPCPEQSRLPGME